MSQNSTPHALYRFYDGEAALLYVGITHNPAARWKTHRDRKPWWMDIASIAVQWYPDRKSALAAEIVAIRAELPRHNVQHIPRPRPATAAWDRGCVSPDCPTAPRWAIGPEPACSAHFMETLARRHAEGPDADLRVTQPNSCGQPRSEAPAATSVAGHECPANKDIDVPLKSVMVGHSEHK